LSILPGVSDLRDAIQAFSYNLGLAKKRPQMGRYTFEEKAEYWALIWGTIIMGITGFMMWNPVFTTSLLPGEFIPASKAAHGGEALLAVMAIVVWHMMAFAKRLLCHVHGNQKKWCEHPLELADIKAGIAVRPVDAKTLRKRRMIFYPAAAVIAAGMLAGVYGFIGSEKTAITTVLPISNPVPVYVPQTPTPAPTASVSLIPAGMLTWEASIGGVFQTKCLICHNTSLATNGLSLTTYGEAMVIHG
jgi:hypothetical protein